MAITSAVWQEHWEDTRSTERISCFRKKTVYKWQFAVLWSPYV